MCGESFKSYFSIKFSYFQTWQKWTFHLKAVSRFISKCAFMVIQGSCSGHNRVWHFINENNRKLSGEKNPPKSNVYSLFLVKTALLGFWQWTLETYPGSRGQFSKYLFWNKLCFFSRRFVMHDAASPRSINIDKKKNILWTLGYLKLGSWLMHCNLMELLSLNKFFRVHYFLNTIMICNCDSPLSWLKDSFFRYIISTLSQKDWRKTFLKSIFTSFFLRQSGFYLRKA